MIKRIILHWTAGGSSLTKDEKDHYNFLTDTKGILVEGAFAPEDQTPANIAKGTNFYAAHTLNCNSYSLGHAIDAMADAQERPFKPGSNPITQVQLDGFVRNNAYLSFKYGVPITRQTILSHAEVQPTLGIKQKGKWDICWLPGMDKPGDPVEVGDRLRDLIAQARKDMGSVSELPTAVPSQPVIRRGSRGEPVARLQALLNALGFSAGKIDGIFGGQTELALVAYQRFKGLSADGIAGKQTWASFDN